MFNRLIFMLNKIEIESSRVWRKFYWECHHRMDSAKRDSSLMKPQYGFRKPGGTQKKWRWSRRRSTTFMHCNCRIPCFFLESL